MGLLLAGMLLAAAASAQEVVRLVQFENRNHPQVGYWFLTPDIVEDDRYLADFEEMLDKAPYDLYFLDAREGASFNNLDPMHQVVKNIVERAHERDVKVGIRLYLRPEEPLAYEDREGFLGECSVPLNRHGRGSCPISTRFIRHREQIVEKRVYRVFAFRETEHGFYDPGTLRAVERFSTRVKERGIEVLIDGGPELAGHTVFVMAIFQQPAPNNFSPRAIGDAMNFIDAYSDIPLDGIMLDEYKNWALMPPWQLMFRLGDVRNRLYSKHLGDELERRTGEPAGLTLLNMRYAPQGRPEVRMKAINDYMDLVREGPMRVENAVYERSKEVFGNDMFMSAHNTFHNNIEDDEIWNTGLKWWTIPRGYGHTDEMTILPVQMGVAMAYPARAMYNMYYDWNAKRFQEKALADLRYGVRTHYHAFNDNRWGKALEDPEAYERLNPVENGARLMNRFDPALPDIRLLVIFGVEAVQNWYPDESARGRYDVNSSLGIEKKAVELWESGYLNALLPSDLVNEGLLTLNEDNRPELNGHTFDAVVYLYPQYSKQPVMDFLEQYAAGGGKLMLVGDATHDFQARDASGWFTGLSEQARVTKFGIDKIGLLGISKNRHDDYCVNEDGSRIITDLDALRSGRESRFELEIDGDTWSFSHTGFAAIATDEDGMLDRFTVTGGRELGRNGETLLELERATDLFIGKGPGGYRLEILDPDGDNRLRVDRLGTGGGE